MKKKSKNVAEDTRIKKLDVLMNYETGVQKMNENLGIIIMLFAMAAFSILESILSFLEKGIPLNNFYFNARSEEEKERLDMKFIYRQTAIVFGLIGLMLLILALLILFEKTELVTPIVIPFCIVTVGYTLVSSIKML